MRCLIVSNSSAVTSTCKNNQKQAQRDYKDFGIALDEVQNGPGYIFHCTRRFFRRLGGLLCLFPIPLFKALFLEEPGNGVVFQARIFLHKLAVGIIGFCVDGFLFPLADLPGRAGAYALFNLFGFNSPQLCCESC